MDNKDLTNEKQKAKRASIGKKMFSEIKARNRYYYIFYRYSILFVTLSFINLMVSLLFLIYFINQNVPPRYVPTDNQMRYFSVLPLSVHEKTDTELQTFVMITMKDLLSYDYVNYDEQLTKSQDRFTEKGWRDFVSSLNKSFILSNTVDKKWISSYKNTSIPKIVKKGISKETGIAYWLVETRGEIMYFGESSRTDRVTVRLKIDRVSTLQKESGIGIERLIISIDNPV